MLARRGLDSRFRRADGRERESGHDAKRRSWGKSITLKTSESTGFSDFIDCAERTLFAIAGLGQKKVPRI